MKVRVQTDLSLSLYAMTPTRKAYTDLTLPTREKGGVDRFGEYPCVICALSHVQNECNQCVNTKFTGPVDEIRKSTPHSLAQQGLRREY